MIEAFDAIVIGAGEAGAVVASRAVARGKWVAMIYRPPYGSTCLNTGCVPSKFLIHRARVAHIARTAARFHVKTEPPRVELAAIVREKRTMVREHRSQAFRNAHAVEYLTLVQGDARFISGRKVVVGDRVLRADRIFIATGMRPSLPAIDGLDRVTVLTNENVMDLAAVPQHLAVIGGGYIACELGQTFHRLGSRVTILQARSHLCPREEPDVSTLLERAFSDEGIDVLLNHEVTRVEPTPEGGIRVCARPPAGSHRTLDATHLLVAAGRRPNTDTLALDAAGVETDATGGIIVNDYLETSTPGIWAIGDVNGQQPFTRVCQEEAKVAYANAFEGARMAVERLSLGHAVFADPEIGSVGLTELQAREQGYRVAVGLITFDQVPKAELMGETTGLIKYVVDRQTRRILGCHVIGPDASNLIYSATVVMRRRGRLDDLARSVGIFPTLQEGMEGAARGLMRRMAPENGVGLPVAAAAHTRSMGVRWR